MYKKHLLLLNTVMLLCASAHASAPVQIYGLMDIGFGSFKDAGGIRSSQVASGKMTTSYLGFRASENLGNGLKVLVALESHIRLDSGQPGRNATDPFFSRNSYISLQSKSVGNLTLGRYNTPLWLAALSTNPFGSSTGYSPSMRSLFGTTGKTGGDGVWNNSVVYQSPTLMGFNASLQFAMRESNLQGNSGLNIFYRPSNKLRVAAAYQKVGMPYTQGHEKTYFLGGSYQFSQVQTYLQYAQVSETNTLKATADTKDKIYQIGVQVPIAASAYVFSAAYANAKTTGKLEGRREFVTFGLTKKLSKRTEVYTVLMLDHLKSQASANSFAAGIKHAF